MISFGPAPHHALCLRHALVVLLFAALFAVAQWHLLQMLMGERYDDAYQSAQNTVHGLPYWRVFQSRVLGPYAVQAMTLLWPGYARCFILFNVLCLTAAGCLAYYTGAFMNRRTGGLVGFLLFQSLFALCLNPYIYYAWDSVDIVVFYVFFALVIRGAAWPWMTLLFAVAILNRESALFIALWLIVDPLCRWAVGRLGYGREEKLNVASVAAGVACMVLGLVLIEVLRNALLVEELGLRKGAPDVYGTHVFLTLHRNLDALLAAVTFANRELGAIVPAFLAVTVVMTVRLVAARPTVFLGTGLIYLAQLAAVLVVGVVFETRVLIDFIPLVTVAAASLLAPADAETGRAC